MKSLETMRQTEFSLDDRYARESGAIYLSGVQALARILIDQNRADRRRGLRTGGFVCGYPGSPVGGVDHELERAARFLQAHDIVHRRGLNEELAATAAFGTQTLRFGARRAVRRRLRHVVRKGPGR